MQYSIITKGNLWRRVALVPVFVALCYLYDWPWLRAATTTILVQLSALLGAPMHRLGQDLVESGGVQIQFVIACTMLDAFFGAIPLLWRASLGLAWNIFRLVAVFLGISVLNILRLEAGFVAFNRGVPWWLAHECVAGIAYFCLLVFIVRDMHGRGGVLPGRKDRERDSERSVTPVAALMISDT